MNNLTDDHAFGDYSYTIDKSSEDYDECQINLGS